MKLTVPTAALKAALAPVVRASGSARSTPQLAGALLTVSGTTLSVLGTDNDIAVECQLAVSDAEDGVALVPAALLAQLTSAAAGDTVTLSQSDNDEVVIFKSASATSKIRSLDAKDFPKMEATDGTTLELTGGELAAALGVVRHAVSSDESKVLAGVFIDTSTATPVAVATDSMRLASCELPAGLIGSAIPDVIIPGRTIAELLRSNVDEKVKMTIGSSVIDFQVGTERITSRMIAGPFPAWRGLVDVERAESFEVDATAMADAIKRVETMNKGTTHIEISVVGQVISVSLSGPAGSMVDTVPAIASSADLTFRVNPKYFLDALANAGSASVEVRHSGDPAKPLELRRPGSTVVRNLVMPIRIS